MEEGSCCRKQRSSAQMLNLCPRKGDQMSNVGRILDCDFLSFLIRLLLKYPISPSLSLSSSGPFLCLSSSLLIIMCLCHQEVLSQAKVKTSSDRPFVSSKTWLGPFSCPFPSLFQCPPRVRGVSRGFASVSDTVWCLQTLAQCCGGSGLLLLGQ